VAEELLAAALRRHPYAPGGGHVVQITELSSTTLLTVVQQRLG
jgi:hypothetical protein